MLVIGNDITFKNFVQDYTRIAIELTDIKNSELIDNAQVFLIPSGFNSLAHFIATREPLYRQNVFQFFS